MPMKKCDGGSSRAAGRAGPARDRVKKTDWPGQAQGQPRCRQRHCGGRNTQPDQLVICFAGSERLPNNLHDTSSSVMTPRCDPAKHEDDEECEPTANNCR